MSPENTNAGGSFYWPVMPGDSWYPNIRRWYHPTEYGMHDAYIPRGLVHVLARPLRERMDGGEILFWYISLVGDDDHSMTTRESKWQGRVQGHRLSLTQVKDIVRRFPNPMSSDYVYNLSREGRPLFFTD
jgi:hypothetical protein